MKMMKNLVLVAAMLSLAALLVGCGTTMVAPAARIGGLDAQPLKCDASYTVMDTVKGTGEVTALFGLRIGGASTYGRISDGRAVLGPQHDAVGIATYDALMKAKDADTILPMTTTVEISGFPPFYWVKTATVT